MAVAAAEAPPAGLDFAASAYAAAIPSIIHQIDFTVAEKPATGSEAWQAYARHFHYGYRLWTTADSASLAAMLGPEAGALLRQALELQHVRYASELARIGILRRLGGIFADRPFGPPQRDGVWVDLRRVAPTTGLVVSLAAEGHNIGCSAILAATGFLMVAPEHPVFAALNESAASNHARWSARNAPFDARYAAGIFAFNKALRSVYAVLSTKLLDELSMRL